MQVKENGVMTSDRIANLQDLIKDSIGGEVVEQKVESLLPPGENYGSIIKKVDFKVKKDGKIKEYHAVAKCTPLNTFTQEVFKTQVTFKLEIAWYTTVIPTWKQFQRDHGVEKVLDFFQQFYGARISLDPNSEKVDLDAVILTENLKYLGFHNVDRHVGFDLPTTKTILRDLATFHAVPLAIKYEKPELFDKNIKPYLTSIGDMPDNIKEAVNQQHYVTLERIPEYGPIMDRIKKYTKNAIIFGERPTREPWTTVIHLDFWSNNIMVTGGENSKTIILDLQVPCLGSPGADLVFFILTSVELKVAEQNFDYLLKFYYDEFIKNLKELNVPTEEYTFDSLLQEIDTEMKIGEFSHSLGHSFIMLGEKGQTTFVPPDANFKTDNMSSLVEPNERQIKRLGWIAAEAVKRNWI